MRVGVSMAEGTAAVPPRRGNAPWSNKEGRRGSEPDLQCLHDAGHVPGYPLVRPLSLSRTHLRAATGRSRVYENIRPRLRERRCRTGRQGDAAASHSEAVSGSEPLRPLLDGRKRAHMRAQGGSATACASCLRQRAGKGTGLGDGRQLSSLKGTSF